MEFRSHLHQSSRNGVCEVKAYPVDVRRRGEVNWRVEITKRSCCRLRGRDRFWLGLCLSCLTQGCRGSYEFCARLILAIKGWVISHWAGDLHLCFFFKAAEFCEELHFVNGVSSRVASVQMKRIYFRPSIEERRNFNHGQMCMKRRFTDSWLQVHSTAEVTYDYQHIG
jgi:hypothetical protein